MIRFTKDEKTVLIFLVFILFVGTSVSYYKKLHPERVTIADYNEKRVEKRVKININNATEEELIGLENIGPVLARRIISYREENGPFRGKEELKKVKGIGDKTFEKIRDDIATE